jgi:hypothetical protein
MEGNEMLRKMIIIVAITLIAVIPLQSQNSKLRLRQPRTLEGVVVAREEGPRWVGIVVESASKKYLVTLAYNPDAHVKDPAVIGGDVEAIGTRVRITFTGWDPWPPDMLALYATRVVRLPQRSVAPSTPANDWDSFWTTFRSAVKRRDRAALKTMMIRDFEWSFGLYPPGDHRDTLFRSLDRYHNWTTLDQVLAKGVSTRFENGKELRIARASGNFGAWRAGFERDSDGRWRWIFFVSGD